MCDNLAVTDERLVARLYYWEFRLDLALCPSADPVVRLDYIIETFLADQPDNVIELRKLSEAVVVLKKRNKQLEYRWTKLREWLGIKNAHEETW